MKQQLFYTACLAWIMACVLPLHAQPVYSYSIQSYGPDDGFSPYQSVHSVNQDNSGLLWIATDNGLFSFDGIFFESFRRRPGHPQTLPSNIVHYNYQDRSGRYWVYVYGKGLYNYDKSNNTFSLFAATDTRRFNINGYELGQPFEDSRGRLWFPVLSYGLARYDPATNAMIPYPVCFTGNCRIYRSASWINSFLEDPVNGKFWLATNHGLVLFSPETGSSAVYTDNRFDEQPTGEKAVYLSLCAGPDKKIWVGTWSQGLKSFDPVTQRFETYLPHPQKLIGSRNICEKILVKNDHQLWVSSLDQGLMVFDLKEKKFSPVYSVSASEPQTATNRLFLSSGKLLWYFRQGKLHKLASDESVFSYTPLPELPGEEKGNAFCFLKTKDKLLAGSALDDPKLLVLNLTTRQFRSVRLPEGQKNYDVWCIKQADDGSIWVATTFGLYLFDEKKDRLIRPENDGNAALKAVAKQLCFDKSGQLWIASEAGLVCYNREKKNCTVYAVTGTPSLPTNELYAVFADRQDNVWVGMNTYGLGVLKQNRKEFIVFDKKRNAAYPQANGTSISESKDGKILYTIRGEGLCMLSDPFTNKEKVKVINASNALPSDFVNSVLRDRQDRIWLLHAAGISLFDPQSEKSINITGKEGLLRSNYSNRPYMDDDGFLYVGNENGFQRFHPDSLLASVPDNTGIHISGFMINNIKRDSGFAGRSAADKIILRPGENNISLQFAALTPSFSNLVRYQYRLKGFNPDWQTAEKNTISYNNLPPGTYELQIRTGFLDGSWNEGVFSKTIVIRKPWYKQNLFLTLCTLLLAAGLYALYQFRIRNLKEKIQLKASYEKRVSEIEMKALRAQMNPHFIFNCLNSINRYIVKSDEKTASGYLTKFSKLIRLILDNSTADFISLEKETETLRLYIEMERLRFDHVFDYTISTEDSLQQQQVFIPPMLIQPYVENAIWHGLLHLGTDRKGLLQLHFTQPEENVLLVTITDNGVGRKKAAQHTSKDALKAKSYGMQITKDRLLLINNLSKLETKFSMEDLTGKNGEAAGTSVHLQIPFKPEP